MRRPNSLLPLLFFLLLGSSLSRAEEFCVASSADLQQALIAASGNAQDDEIRVVVGFYLLNAVTFPASEPFALTLSGGWVSECLARINNPEATLLQSVVADAALLEFQSGTANSSISNLTVINGVLRFLRTASVRVAGVNIEAGDRDGDGVSDDRDDFPDDPDEQFDTDGDGIGNNKDTDDDNDRMPDVYEQRFGLNPLVDDAGDDLDGDSYTNFEEFEWGTVPNDPGDIPVSIPAWLLLLPAISDS